MKLLINIRYFVFPWRNWPIKLYTWTSAIHLQYENHFIRKWKILVCVQLSQIFTIEFHLGHRLEKGKTWRFYLFHVSCISFFIASFPLFAILLPVSLRILLSRSRDFLLACRRTGLLFGSKTISNFLIYVMWLNKLFHNFSTTIMLTYSVIAKHISFSTPVSEVFYLHVGIFGFLQIKAYEKN